MKSRNNLLRYLSLIIFFTAFILNGCKKNKDEITVTDSDGNLYHTVTIGSQVWFVENLKTTKYNEGTSIPNIITPNDWVSINSAGYCWYNNDPAANKEPYGALYNFPAMSTGKLCPVGWHVPDNNEWTSLIGHLGGDSISYKKLKVVDSTPWGTGATNESGFSAFPGGYRWGSFYNLSFGGFWWSTSSTSKLSSYFFLMEGKSEVVAYNYGYGFSVRCLKD